MTDATTELLAERGKTHGDFTDHALVTQSLKLVMWGHNTITIGDKEPTQVKTNWANLNAHQREALEMIQHKIGRILSGNAAFRDHWDDIAGYARLVAERCPT